MNKLTYLALIGAVTAQEMPPMEGTMPPMDGTMPPMEGMPSMRLDGRRWSGGRMNRDGDQNYMGPPRNGPPRKGQQLQFKFKPRKVFRFINPEQQDENRSKGQLDFQAQNLDQNQCSGNKCDGYRGDLNKTDSGFECQRWNSQSPHEHSRTPSNMPNMGLGDHNKCRNPDGEETIWCYTTDTGKRWDYCNLNSASDNGLNYKYIAADGQEVSKKEYLRWDDFQRFRAAGGQIEPQNRNGDIRYREADQEGDYINDSTTAEVGQVGDFDGFTETNNNRCKSAWEEWNGKYCETRRNTCNEIEVQMSDGSCHLYEPQADDELMRTAWDITNSMKRWMDTKNQIEMTIRNMGEQSLRNNFRFDPNCGINSKMVNGKCMDCSKGNLQADMGEECNVIGLQRGDEKGDWFLGRTVDGKREGRGEYRVAKTGDRFIGEFRDNKANGYGQYTDNVTGTCYWGHFENNKLGGRAEIQYGSNDKGAWDGRIYYDGEITRDDNANTDSTKAYDGWNVTLGWDSPYNDISSSTMNIKDCLTACNEDSNCKVVVHSGEKYGNYCWLKSKTAKESGNWLQQENRNYYEKNVGNYRKEKGACRQVANGEDGPDSNNQVIWSVSKNDCEETCNKNPECFNYEYNHIKQGCDIWSNLNMYGNGQGDDVNCFIKETSTNSANNSLSYKYLASNGQQVEQADWQRWDDFQRFRAAGGQIQPQNRQGDQEYREADQDGDYSQPQGDELNFKSVGCVTFDNRRDLYKTFKRRVESNALPDECRASAAKAGMSYAAINSQGRCQAGDIPPNMQPDVCQCSYPNTGACNDACVRPSDKAEEECRRSGHKDCKAYCLVDMGLKSANECASSSFDNSQPEWIRSQECNIPCKKDKSQTCGGLSDTAEVWQVGNFGNRCTGAWEEWNGKYCATRKNTCNDQEVQKSDGSCHYYEPQAADELMRTAQDANNSMRRFEDVRRQIEDTQRNEGENDLRNDFKLDLGCGINNKLVDGKCLDCDKGNYQSDNGQECNLIGLQRGDEKGDWFMGRTVNGKKEGRGEYRVGKTGDRHIGNFKDGKPNGQGEYLDNVSGTRYFGHFQDGQLAGHAEILYGSKDKNAWDNRIYYEGEIAADGTMSAQGKGWMEFQDRSSIEGMFADNMATGFGRLTKNDGSIWEGNFLSGKPVGMDKGLYFDARTRSTRACNGFEVAYNC